MKGIVIAGTGSGVGKTSLTTGLISKISKRKRVQPFKVGPDFIDPLYHSIASGRLSRNLDSFMLEEGTISNLAEFASKDADISIVEGVRGLFEGFSATDDIGSTGHIARLLGLPVVLVVDSSSLTRSAAAIINGFKSFDDRINIAGVILNNVSGNQHQRKLEDVMERYVDLEVLGYVRKDKGSTLEQRYLGLKTMMSHEKDALESLEGLVESIDLDRVFDIAERFAKERDFESPYPDVDGRGIKVAIPRDEAYCFHYNDNVNCLRHTGIDVVEYSPLKGDQLPNADIHIIGGGYPELFAEEISENRDFLEGLKSEAGNGTSIVGECGGLMTLCNSIVDAKGAGHGMAGVFDATARMSGKRHGPTYVISNANANNPIFSGSVKGHEYHYSEVELHSRYDFGFDMSRGEGIADSKDGAVFKNCIGSYMHQHGLSTDRWIKGLVNSVK